MHKMLKTLVLAVMLLVAPAAFAQQQHQNHNGGHQNSGKPSGAHQSDRSRNSGHASERGNQGRGGGRGEARGGNRERRGNFDINRGRLRGDHEGRLCGRDHGFRDRDLRWFGPRFGIGSRFFWGGFWFEVYDPWFFGPYDPYFIEYDEMYGGYFVYSPTWPGHRIGITVVF
jgi:hypothetical protein